MHRLTRKDVCVRAVAYLPDGRLVSATGEKTVRVWEPLAGKQTNQIRTRDFIFGLAVSPTGEIALAGRNPPGTDDSELTVGLPDAEQLDRHYWPIRRIYAYDHRTRSIWSLGYTGDDNHLIAARRVMGGGNMYDGGDCHWWRRKPAAEGELIPASSGYSVGTAAIGARFAVTATRQLILFDHPCNPAVIDHPFSASWAAAVAFLPTGAVVVGANAFLLFTDRMTKTGRFQPLKTDVRTIRTLAVSPDGRTLLVGGSPGRVEVYDLESRVKRTTYDFDVGVVQSMAFAPDGLTFAVGAEKGLLVVDAE